jgi:hypothetical protein
MPVSGVASGTASVVVSAGEEEEGEDEEEELPLLFSTQTIVAKAARCEMRVTRQRTTSPADREEEAVSAALLLFAAVRLTTETSGLRFIAQTVFFFWEGRRTEKRGERRK